MWSLDWFEARKLARKGIAIRRVAWTRGIWLKFSRSLWWLRLPDLSWRVVQCEDFGEAEFRARDWTDQPYTADVCGARPAFNATSAGVDKSWGDAIEMHPRPVPNYPDQ